MFRKSKFNKKLPISNEIESKVITKYSSQKSFLVEHLISIRRYSPLK